MPATHLRSKNVQHLHELSLSRNLINTAHGPRYPFWPHTLHGFLPAAVKELFRLQKQPSRTDFKAYKAKEGELEEPNHPEDPGL
jgi:hypothetical protein